MYPYSEAQVLTEDLFVAYGGLTGSSTLFQRNAARLIAEKWMTTQVGTFILETTVTGTYHYPTHGNSFVLDHTYVSDVKEIRFLDTKGTNYYTITGTSNYYAAIRNYERGIVDVFSILGYCRACGYGWEYLPYKFEIPYTAGLPTGTYASPDFLMALTMASQIALDEIVGMGGEAFSGITEFRNQEYMEKRLMPTMTAFGASPKAQFIKSLVEDIIKLNVVGL